MSLSVVTFQPQPALQAPPTRLLAPPTSSGSPPMGVQLRPQVPSSEEFPTSAHQDPSPNRVPQSYPPNYLLLSLDPQPPPSLPPFLNCPQTLSPPPAENRALRLVGGSSRCAGRVEMLEQGQWGSVCDDTWDLEDSHVVCRQLNCGWAIQAVPGLHFAPGQGPIHRDQVNCSGEETYLWDCPGLPGDGYCGHKEDAGVVCSGQREGGGGQNLGAAPNPRGRPGCRGGMAPADVRSSPPGRVRPRQVQSGGQSDKQPGKGSRVEFRGGGDPELEGQACPPPGGNDMRGETLPQCELVT